VKRKMKNPNLTDEKRQQIIDLWAAGTSASEIGRIVGFTKNMIMGYVRRWDLPTRKNPITGVVPAERKAWVQKSAAQRLAERAEHEAKAAELRAKLEAELFTPTATTSDPPEPIVVRLSPQTKRTCQWLNGDPRKLDFCGCDAVPGKPYCETHVSRAYVKIVARDLARV